MLLADVLLAAEELEVQIARLVAAFLVLYPQHSFSGSGGMEHKQ